MQSHWWEGSPEHESGSQCAWWVYGGSAFMHAHNTDTHATQRTLCKGKVTVPHCSSLKTHDFALRSFHVVFTWDKHCHSCTPLVYYIHLTNTGYLIKWPVSVHCFESFHGLQPVCPFSSVCRALVIIFFSLRDLPLSSGAGCASVKITVNQFVIHSCFSSFLMLALNLGESSSPRLYVKIYWVAAIWLAD